MSDIKSLFGTNKDAETQGVWVPFYGEIELLVARDKNPAHRARLLELNSLSPSRLAGSRKITIKDLDRLEDISRKAAARHILLGWKGLEYEGKPLEYSESNALMLFETLPDFYNEVVQISQDQRNYLEEEQEAAQENSEAASAGS